jgi:hypothetical protein
VSGRVTGLERGYTYWYEVAASNLAGETRSGGDNVFSYFYAGGSPTDIRECHIEPCRSLRAVQRGLAA